MATDDDLGSGIGLDETFDFRVTEVGDIMMTRGHDEVEKDLAYFTVIRLYDYVGASRVTDPTLLKQVEVDAEDVLQEDGRVEEVVSVSATPAQNDNHTIDVEAEVNLVEDGTTLEFIIPV